MIILVIILSTIVCFLSGMVWYLFSQYRNMKTEIENHNTNIVELQRKITKRIGFDACQTLRKKMKDEINDSHRTELDYICEKANTLPHRFKVVLDEQYGDNYSIYIYDDND